MKKSILSLFTFLFIQTISFGQVTQIDLGSERLLNSSRASDPVEALGSPYVDENFLPVKIKGYNQLFTGRYNAYNGEMEIDLGTKIIALDKNNDYELMYTQNNKIYKTYRFISPSGISKKRFLNVILENEKFTLLKEEIIKYQEKIPAANSYSKDQPAKFEKSKNNYYLKQGKSITYISTKKKDLLKTYPENAKKLKSYLKENKISLKKESDMIKLAGFLADL